MSTISLFASQVNQFPGLVKGISNKVSNFKTELTSIRNKSLNIDKSICNLDEIIDSVKSATDTQDDKVEMLDTLSADCEKYILDTVAIDDDVEDIINESKDDFYDEYYFLKPECEKNPFEKIKGGFTNLCQWCKAHWKQILITIAVVVGTVLAVVAVIASGGMALVPLLTSVLTFFGMGVGTATAIATVASLTVAGLAITFSAGSCILNCIDIWCNVQNPVFKTFKTIFNIGNTAFNLIYGAGAIYCGIKGISNKCLVEYSKCALKEGNVIKNFFSGKGVFNTEFLNNLKLADDYAFDVLKNESIFWTGMKNNGGEQVALDYAKKNGGKSLEILFDESGIARPSANGNWVAPSASAAMRASGEVTTLVGTSPWAGSIWNTTEKILLNINSKVVSITIKEIFSSNLPVTTVRTFEFGTTLNGFFNWADGLLNFFD